jgi:dTDP-4-amino-4,6-dideoxygalactose transaminase
MKLTYGSIDNMTIPFNVPPTTGNELSLLTEVLNNKKFSGDGPFNKKCQTWFETNFHAKSALMTPSCTAALEMAALLLNIGPDDEVIMPSYTFVSTANAFVLRGAKVKFVDVRPDTMNIDEKKIEAAITSKTKAIVPVHYAGVSCEMDVIMSLARKHDIYVIEDAAQGVMATYKGNALGTIGHIGCYSFHETKNYTAGGEGGCIIVNDNRLIQRAEVIREKGTNRSIFLKGQIDKYTWVDLGSSFLPSELQAAFLFAQLQSADEINRCRLEAWHLYYKLLEPLQQANFLELPFIPSHCTHNAHMFYIKLENEDVRDNLINHLKSSGIQSVFHYIPLHSAPYGKKVGEFVGEDRYTTKHSKKLLRLPLWFGISKVQVSNVCDSVERFF